MKKKTKLDLVATNGCKATTEEIIPVKIDKSKQERLQKLIADINRERGENSISFASDVKVIERIPTGVKEIDEMIGAGIVRGAFNTIWGRKGCLSFDTKIKYSTINYKGKFHKNKKTITIEKLYKNFHKINESGSGKYFRKQLENKDFFVNSINEKNIIIKNKIIDVVNSGIQQVYRITTENGFSIKATENHNFYIGENKYKSLKDLKINDVIYVFNNEKKKTEGKKQARHKNVSVKFHPKGNLNYINKIKYYRIPESHLVYESYKNNFSSVNEYRTFLNKASKKEINKLWFIDKSLYEVHHKDRNPFNNQIENLELLTKEQHHVNHYENIKENCLYFTITPVKITKIDKLYKEQTYDICMESPYNNYLANSFVVHNSAKTSLAYRIVSQAQKKGLNCLMISLERTYDKVWAEKQGVDNSKLLLAPTYTSAEDVMDDINKFCKEGAVDLIILDSVDGLSPKGETETKKGAEVSISHDEMALLPRKLSKFFRVVSGAAYKANVAILLIGQTRTGLGGFIALDTLSGGNAIQHWSSIILHIKRGAKADAPTKKVVIDGKKTDKRIGFLSVVSLEKRKVESEPEGSEVRLPFYYEKGF